MGVGRGLPKRALVPLKPHQHLFSPSAPPHHPRAATQHGFAPPQGNVLPTLMDPAHFIQPHTWMYYVRRVRYARPPICRRSCRHSSTLGPGNESEERCQRSISTRACLTTPQFVTCRRRASSAVYTVDHLHFPTRLSIHSVWY